MIEKQRMNSLVKPQCLLMDLSKKLMHSRTTWLWSKLPLSEMDGYLKSIVKIYLKIFSKNRQKM